MNLIKEVKRLKAEIEDVKEKLEYTKKMENDWAYQDYLTEQLVQLNDMCEDILCQCVAEIYGYEAVWYEEDCYVGQLRPTSEGHLFVAWDVEELESTVRKQEERYESI